MKLQRLIETFVENPFPLWENELTTHLVAEQSELLVNQNITLEDYCTAKAYLKDAKLPTSTKRKVFGTTFSDSIFIEYPQPELLSSFYEDSGLSLLTHDEIDSINGIEKIKCALETLEKVPGVLDTIAQLVKCIGVLKQDDPEIDISHSDPDIPFSIFLSVCDETSEISNLRVAESILHEAMHLKLTMIEHHVDLIVPGSEAVFYSPWRDEDRPVRGVLHGLFVFKAIACFFEELLKASEIKYARNRLEDIYTEIHNLVKFQFSVGLTNDGKILCARLLQWASS